MDPHGFYGDLVVLKMEAVNGKLPLHPFMIRKSIESWIQGKIDGAFPERQGLSYALKVRNKRQYERLLAMTKLNNDTPIKISKHTSYNTTRCVISCRDMAEIDDEDALTYLAEQHVSEIRRITRRSANGKDRENTSTVILTIDGTTVPEFIDVGYLRCKTRPYYPSPMLCYKCYNFGHTKARCQQTQPTCGTCAKQHPMEEGERCNKPAFCHRCNSTDHQVSSRKCPEYIREDAIQHIRVDKGISYPAAKKIFGATNDIRTYAGATNASKDQAIIDLTAKYDSLAHQMSTKLAEKDQTIEYLKDQLNSNNKGNNNAEFLELKKMIQELRVEIQQKDKRIKALETGHPPSDRMELTRRNGTIEDLVKRVQSLEESSAAKEKENITLRAENAALREHVRKHGLSLQSPTGEARQTPTKSTGAIKKKVAKQASDEKQPKRKKEESAKPKNHTTQQNSCRSTVSISDSEENVNMDMDANDINTTFDYFDVSSDETMEDHLSTQ